MVSAGSDSATSSLGPVSMTVHTKGSGAVTPGADAVRPSPPRGIITKLCCRFAFSGTGRQKTCSTTTSVNL